jgi:hypothetical protein
VVLTGSVRHHRQASHHRRHRGAEAEISFSNKQEKNMHWIDPESLPEIRGTVERFIVNPHGEVDGFVMKDQAEMPILVHTPPHLGDELTCEVKIGAKVGVRGVRPRGAHLIAAVAIVAENARQVVDRGPEHDREHPKPQHRKMEAKSKVRLSLFGPQGDLRGALLADGTILRLGPKEAKEVAGLLVPDAMVAATGEGIETKHGRVIEVKEIGTEPGSRRPVHKPKPKHGQPKPKHQDEARA